MGKNPDDCTPDFVSGLLPELRSQGSQVRAGNAGIQYAKLAELCQIKNDAEEIAAVECSEEALQIKDPIENKASLLLLADGIREIREGLATLQSPPQILDLTGMKYKLSKVVAIIIIRETIVTEVRTQTTGM